MTPEPDLEQLFLAERRQRLLLQAMHLETFVLLLKLTP